MGGVQVASHRCRSLCRGLFQIPSPHAPLVIPVTAIGGLLYRWIAFGRRASLGRQVAPLTHYEADDLGHRLEVFGRDFFVNINPGLKRAGQGRVFDQRHVIGLGDFPDPHRQVIDPLGNQYWR